MILYKVSMHNCTIVKRTALSMDSDLVHFDGGTQTVIRDSLTKTEWFRTFEEAKARLLAHLVEDRRLLFVRCKIVESSISNLEHLQDADLIQAELGGKRHSL